MQQKSVALSTGQAIPTGQVSKTNLPVFLTPLLGRERELMQISLLLQRSEMRLLTLTGPEEWAKPAWGWKLRVLCRRGLLMASTLSLWHR